jgi:MFS family permease
MTDRERRGDARRVVATCFVTLFVSTGITFAFGVLFKPLLGQVGSGRGPLAAAASLNLLINAGMQPLLGHLLDRVGARRVLATALVLMTLGSLAVARASHLWELYLFYGVVTALGHTGTGILPISVLITRRFPGRRGFTLAVAATGFSFGQAAFAQLASVVSRAAGWRLAYVGFALATAALIPLVLWAIREPAAQGSGAGKPGAPAGSAPGEGRGAVAAGELWEAIRSPAYVLSTGAYLVCGFTDFMITTHLAPLATDLHLPEAAGADALSVLALANVAGILVAGRAADRLGAAPVLAATYLVRAAALAYLPAVEGRWGLTLFAGAFGLTFFTTAPLTSTLLGELFGPRRLGTLLGTAALFHHAGGAAGTFLAGLAFDRTGQYRAIVQPAALLVLLAAVAMRAVRAPAGAPAPGARAGDGQAASGDTAG